MPTLWPAKSDHLIAEMRENLKPKRFRHVLGVVATALGLAETHGVPKEKVGWAALLHDYCKCGTSEEQRALAEKWSEVIPPEDEPFPGLWHAWAAAGVAQGEFGITDSEILDAIRHHSTGAGAMSSTLKILVLADYLEPTRGFAERFALWQLAHRDLDAALTSVIDSKCQYLKDRGVPCHPRAVAALESLTQKTLKEV